MDAAFSNTTTAEFKCRMLDNSKWGTSFEWDELYLICTHMDLLKARSGSILFNEGSESDYFGIIIKGKVKIQKTDAKKKVVDVRVLQTPHTIGEMGMIDGYPRSAKATVISPLLMLTMNEEQFDTLSENHPRLALKFYQKITQLMSYRLRSTTGQLLDSLSA